MSGVRPFDGSTFGELLLNICARPIPPPSSQGLQLPGFDEWFAKATNRDPEQRFASAQELAGTLKDVVAGATSAAFVPPAPALPPTAMMPAPTVSGQGSVPAFTGAAQLSHGAEPALSRSRPSALPWILLALLLLSGGAAATLLLLRSKPSAVAEGVASATRGNESANVAAPGPTPTLAAPAEPAPAASSTVTKPVAIHPGPASKPATPAAATPATPATPVAIHPLPTPAAPSVKAVRCFSDPFSGLIRPAGAGQPAGASTFACKQDPFTGKYKRL
jgi:serine/threonine-protein kinase